MYDFHTDCVRSVHVQHPTSSITTANVDKSAGMQPKDQVVPCLAGLAVSEHRTTQKHGSSLMQSHVSIRTRLDTRVAAPHTVSPASTDTSTATNAVLGSLESLQSL